MMAIPNPLFIRKGNFYLKVRPEDILVFKAEDNYVRMYLKEEDSVVLYHSLKSLEEQFVGGSFLRVHRGYIINVKALDRWDLELNELHVGPYTVPLSRSRRKALEKALHLFN